LKRRFYYKFSTGLPALVTPWCSSFPPLMGLPAFVGVVSADDEGITTPEAERMGD
jgi:hypothetical protein